MNTDKLTEGKQNTIGGILKEFVDKHELNPATVDKVLKLTPGTLQGLINDEIYPNKVPVVLFKNLLKSFYISFQTVEPLVIPTFRLVLSKETPESISKKRSGYKLWENEESTLKWVNKLKELMTAPLPASQSDKLTEELTHMAMMTKYSIYTKW